MLPNYLRIGVPKAANSHFEKPAGRKPCVSLESVRQITQGNQTPAAKGLRKYLNGGLLARRDRYAGIDCRR
jgi:hypothetical protein